MATRKIKDAQDTTTNELIYFKGHAKATYMSDGRNVEDAIHQIGTGGGGGGGITEVYIADFTMVSLKTGMVNGHQVECDMQALVAAMNANKIILVRESEDSVYKGVCVLNGYAEDLLYFSIVDSYGDILRCEGTDYGVPYIDGRNLYFHYWCDKQDTLVSGENIKTINGESIIGSGDITISGGSGEQGPQGPQGDKGDKGDTGVGVQSVKQTTTSNVDSGYNVVTVTLTDGTTSTFSVKNGSKGSNGTNGKDGTDGATFTPSVDSAGNLSWTNNKGLTNPPTVNIKGPKGDAGEGGGSGGYKEVVVKTDSSFEALSPHIIYVIEYTVNALFINSFVTSSAPYETYDIIFKTTEMILGGDFEIVLPSNVWWANGIVPTVEVDTLYELSIVKTTIENTDYFKAVLTPFKPV